MKINRCICFKNILKIVIEPLNITWKYYLKKIVKKRVRCFGIVCLATYGQIGLMSTLANGIGFALPISACSLRAALDAPEAETEREDLANGETFVESSSLLLGKSCKLVRYPKYKQAKHCHVADN